MLAASQISQTSAYLSLLPSRSRSEIVSDVRDEVDMGTLLNPAPKRFLPSALVSKVLRATQPRRSTAAQLRSGEWAKSSQ